VATKKSVVEKSTGGVVPAGALMLKLVQRRYKFKSESRMNRIPDPLVDEGFILPQCWAKGLPNGSC
jgi:hypothetical protein